MPIEQTGKVDDLLVSMYAKIDELDQKVGEYMAIRLEALIRQRFAASGIQSKTGALQRSLTVKYNPSDHSIRVGVLIYGVFLSYGVGPAVKNGKIYKLDDWVMAAMNGSPRGGDTFSYEKSYRQYGIKARKWIPGDDALQLIINDFIEEYKLSTLKDE